MGEVNHMMIPCRSEPFHVMGDDSAIWTNLIFIRPTAVTHKICIMNELITRKIAYQMSNSYSHEVILMKASQ